jgi:hypothetical protein
MAGFAPIEFGMPSAGFCKTGVDDTGVCEMMEGPRKCYDVGGIPYYDAVTGMGMCKREGSSQPAIPWDALVAPAIRGGAPPLAFGADALVSMASAQATPSAMAGPGAGNYLADDSAPAPMRSAVDASPIDSRVAPPMAPDVKAAMAAQAKFAVEDARVVPTEVSGAPMAPAMAPAGVPMAPQ